MLVYIRSGMLIRVQGIPTKATNNDDSTIVSLNDYQSLTFIVHTSSLSIKLE